MSVPPLDQVAKKAVLRQWTYGLYAVSVAHAGQVNAFTANWLTQVSFEPPLVAVSVENDSRSIDMLRASGVFAINVFDAHARELAGALGKRSSQAPDKLVYEPGNPLADANGYVKMPNVDVVGEMVNTMSASRSYQANVEVLNTVKSMMLKTLTIGQ